MECAVIEKFASRVDKIFYLAEEIEFLKERVQTHGTGHIITAIGVLENRIEELKQELREMEKQHVWQTLNNE
jgi:hypothetical protein